MAMTPEAKRALSTTIRPLRARLLDDLHDATESAYRLSVRVQDARVDEAKRIRPERLEMWIKEQQRAQGTNAKAKSTRSDADFRRDVEKQAAYTLLNRIVILRLMEAQSDDVQPMRKPALITGGWESPAYRTFRALAPESS